MKQYDTQKEIDLLRRLFTLAARRSMRPSMSDNESMRLLFEELFLLTEKQIYKL